MNTKMKKTKGKYLIIFGLALLIAALTLIIYNIAQDRKSGQYARSVLTELKIEISAAAQATEQSESGEINAETVGEDLFEAYIEETDPIEEETAVVNGDSYIGIISIPKLGIELPVMSEWSYPNLKLSPCRYTGDAESGNIIIAAHNYSSHFGNISELVSGDEIIFTAVNGKEYRYITVLSENLGGTDVERLVNDNENNWNLTLFTCTLSGQSRVCVRAESAD